MSKFLLFLFALLCTQNTMAQEDGEGYYVFKDPNLVKYLEKNMFSYSLESLSSVASELSNILVSSGPWHAVVEISDGLSYSAKMYKIVKDSFIFNQNGTGTHEIVITDDVNYRNVKKLKSIKRIPFTWKTDDTNLRIDFQHNRMTWTNGSQSQLSKLTAAEKQDWQNTLSKAQQRGRGESILPFESRILRVDSNFVIPEYEDSNIRYFVSKSGLQQLLNFRQNLLEKKAQAENRTKVNFLNSITSCPDSNHPHAIDLGLSSGTKWSCCDFGAPSPDKEGNSYMWGEMNPGRHTYTYSVGGGYKGYFDIGKDISRTKYDVVLVKWGNGWHMPNLRSFSELFHQCKGQIIQNDEMKVYGIKLTGPNGNYIFLTGNMNEGSPIPVSGSFWTSEGSLEAIQSKEHYDEPDYKYSYTYGYNIHEDRDYTTGKKSYNIDTGYGETQRSFDHPIRPIWNN